MQWSPYAIVLTFLFVNDAPVIAGEPISVRERALVICTSDNPGGQDLDAIPPQLRIIESYMASRVVVSPSVRGPSNSGRNLLAGAGIGALSGLPISYWFDSATDSGWDPLVGASTGAALGGLIDLLVASIGSTATDGDQTIVLSNADGLSELRFFAGYPEQEPKHLRAIN